MKRRSETPTESDGCVEQEDSVNFRTPVSKHKRTNSNCLSVSVNANSHNSNGTEVVSTAKVNPFEKHILANLHLPFWSPSIFPSNASLMETPPQTTWAIDQISKLFPKAIEDSPSTHQNELKLTPSTEAKAQADIERFFSQSCVLPSPNISTTNSNNSTNELMGAMEISSSPHLNIVRLPHVLQNSQSENIDVDQLQSPATSEAMVDSWTSTLLSFPPQLPQHVEEMLLPYFRYSEGDKISSSTMCPVSVAAKLQTNGTSNRKNAVLVPCLSLNSSNNGSNSRRRRLAFSSTDEDEDENRRCSQLDFSYEEFSPSPMQITSNSPMLMMTPSKIHSSPSSYLMKEGFHMRRSENTPCSSNRINSLQSPNLTPIRRPCVVGKSATAKMLDLTQD